MAHIKLNIQLIRDGKEKDIVSYLDELRQDHTDATICQTLLEAVDREYLNPAVFTVFLSWSKAVDTIALCIRDATSLSIRKQSIKQFGKTLAHSELWESAWRALGGVRGIITLFARISVTEVKDFVRGIGRCNYGQHRVAAREKAIEQLLTGLLPSHYAVLQLQSHDKRPIEDLYAQMLPACSSGFLGQLLDAKDQSNPLYRRMPKARLLKTHGEFVRKRLVEGMFGDGAENDYFHEYLGVFVYSQPSKPGPDPKISASMAFAMKIFELRLGDTYNEKRWPTSFSEADLFFSVLRRFLRRKIPDAKTHDIIMQGLHLLETKPSLKPAFQSGNIWSQVITRWKKAPKLYEDALALALRLELRGSQKTFVQEFNSVLGSLRTDLRWPLLRLYCLHVPKVEIDIDTVNDFKPLAGQSWSSSIFYHLSKAQAVRLLHGLLDANPKYSFLAGPTTTSILSKQDIKSQRNFNVTLLLTNLQRESEGTQKRAESAVDELRKKAATASEQPDRARLAKAASDYAIASGSLELYGETVIWQQRFVRDPLTVKVIFGRDAVTTREGIELLSGIPKPLPEGMTLAEVASRVEQANVILMTFHEMILVAKREPSFHQADWAGVSSLFGSTISERVIRARDICVRPQGPDANMYTAIWAGTLSLLGKVNVDLLKNVYEPIQLLLFVLPPTALVSTANAMLEMGNKKRKKQDRQSGDDVLERLSYDVLRRLAKGDKPELAQQLVLRTILDRPDASSWHRQLLSVSFMNSLSAKSAHEMLLSFATAIGEKLEEQSYVKVGEAQPSQSTPPQSIVKVTTVKYLAQLLENAAFISAEAAVEVLVELFKAGTHRDIRLATLGSLFSLLSNLCSGAEQKWKSNDIVEQIMGAIETVITVVGGVNERYPPRPEDWDEARKTGKLPTISDISAGLPPLLSAMFTASDEPQYPGLKNLQAEFVSRFLLPILGYSQVEHRKWISLFLAKHQVNLDVDDLPATPISPEIWKILVGRYSALIPQKVLEDYNEYIVMTIASPTALKEFNKSLRSNTDLCNTPEVQHWLSVFGKRMDHWRSSDTQTLLSIIHHDLPRPLVRNGIVFNKVSEMVLAHASLFLDDYENHPNIWNDFVADLCHPPKNTHPLGFPDSIRSIELTWQKSGRLVLEKVVTLVLYKKEKHTEEQKRSPMPSATKLRLRLLPYPFFPDKAEVDHQCRDFASQMEILLDTFLKGDWNILRWPKIAEDSFTISKYLNTDDERLHVALYIGRLKDLSDRADNQRTSALNFVRITLAMKLIQDGKNGLKKTGNSALSKQENDLVQRLKSRLEEWQRDINEGIREMVEDWRREQKDLWESIMSV